MRNGWKSILLAAGLILAACGESSETSGDVTGAIDTGSEKRVLDEGAWRGVIEIQGRKLPFRMAVSYSDDADLPRVEFINGEERVAAEEVHVAKDRVSLSMPAFNTRIDARFKDGRLSGVLTKVTTGGVEQKMAVTLTPGEHYRFFPVHKPAEVDVSGRWAVKFEEPDGGNYPAVGVFRQEGSLVYGTFLTPTSDYRYLAGAIRNGRLHLSAWDGYHVFLFEAEILDDGTMKGDFWSGTSSHETWKARRDENAKLPDMDAQTFLKPGVETFDFTFPDLDGNPVSLSDERFQGKPVVVQLAGSWCPNCADETRFLAPWYRENRDRGVEVVALMFEHFDDFERAAEQVRLWREKHGVEYTTLVAGVSDKEDAASRLPQLNTFLAFPTTIFVDVENRVERIQTGFNGPATDRYEAEMEKFNATVNAMLQDSN